MEKSRTKQRVTQHDKLQKALRIMKLNALFLLIGMQFAWANGIAQTKITIKEKTVNYKELFDQIKQQTGYTVMYSNDELDKHGTIAAGFNQADLKDVLDVVSRETGLSYEIMDEFVILKVADLQQPEAVTISGKVTDESGQPLPGVAVQLKGTTVGVATDIDGNFRLVLPKQESMTLVFSFIGMKTQEVIVTDEKPLNIVMQEDVKQMDEVVVTGYQTISKERATGAYAIVDAKILETKPVTNLSEALNGLVPGLAVQSSSVDGDMRFIIRGQGTLQDNQSDRDPLIVVDGFPISDYSNNNDPFSTINPNDVESVTVLKDAAATSIYGARAANGVIVITTKKGQAGNDLDITADAYWSVSSRVNLDYVFNMASAENQFRYVELMNKYVPISGGFDPYVNPLYRKNYMSDPYRLLFERDIKHNITDAEYQKTKQQLIEMGNQGLWKNDLNDYVFRHALHSQYNVALRGATNRINYSFSASYDAEKGYLIGDDDQRIMLNMITSTKLTKNLTFDISINSAFFKSNNNSISEYDLKRTLSPWSRLVDDDGNFIHVSTMNTVYEPILESEYEGKTPADWHYNPVSDRKYMNNESKTMNYRVHGGFNYATMWGLNVSAKGQYEWRRRSSHLEYDPESYYVRDLYNTYSHLVSETGMYESDFIQGGIFTDSGHVYEAYNLRGQIDYMWTQDVHNLSILAGTEILSSSTESMPSITRYGYNKYTNKVANTIDYDKQFTNIFGQETSGSPYSSMGGLNVWEDRFFSIYANAAYTYDDRYSITASFRTDASNFQSKSQRDKFSPFWSLGASWLLSRERFFSKIDWIDMLKLRASIGIAGVAAGKKSTSSVTTVSTNDGNAIFPSSNSINERGNGTLTWEKSRTFNLGVDIALFNHKLFGSAEFYNKYSYDVLSEVTVPAISQGTDKATFNNAEVLNRGVELSLSSDLAIIGDLKWRGILNYAYNSNKVTKFDLTSPISPSYPGFVENYPIGLILTLKPAGYTPEGYVQLQGKDGVLETILTQETTHSSDNLSRNLDENNWFYYIGTSTPKSNLSLSNSFTWKSLTFSFMITGRFGYYVSRDDAFDTGTNNASYSKQLDKSFAVYDKGYATQKGYSAYPLYNDENWKTYNALGYDAVASGMYYASTLFDSNYINGNNIRLNEIFVSYELPENLLKRQGIFSRINVYARASNLGLIWSANGEMDPDYPVGSVKPMPTFTFGLKLGF